MSAVASRAVLFGTVEHVTKAGSFLVVVRSGSLHRNVICAPVDFADVGDEVEVAVGPDLEFGSIVERKARRR